MLFFVFHLCFCHVLLLPMLFSLRNKQQIRRNKHNVCFVVFFSNVVLRLLYDLSILSNLGLRSQAEVQTDPLPDPAGVHFGISRPARGQFQCPLDPPRCIRSISSTFVYRFLNVCLSCVTVFLNGCLVRGHFWALITE